MTKYLGGPGKPPERGGSASGNLDSAPRRVSPRLKQFLMNPPEIELCLLLTRMCYRSSVDWKKTSQRAQSLGWERVVRSSLETCGALFEASFNSAFGSPQPLRRPGVPRPLDAAPPSSNLVLFRLRNTPARKLRNLAVRLFVPAGADCNFCSLPDSLFFLYYVLRPLRVTVKVGGWFLAAGIKRLWRLLRGVHLW